MDDESTGRLQANQDGGRRGERKSERGSQDRDGQGERKSERGSQGRGSQGERKGRPYNTRELERFVFGVRQLGLELNEQELEQFLRYREELLEWNTRITLTAITDPAEVLLKHFLDSLSLLLVYRTPASRLLVISAGAVSPFFPFTLL